MGAFFICSDNVFILKQSVDYHTPKKDVIKQSGILPIFLSWGNTVGNTHTFFFDLRMTLLL